MILEDYIDESSCNLKHCPYGEDMYCYDCINKMLEEYKAKVRADAIEEVKRKMISLHTDMILQYGVDIIEGRADAFDELKDWLEKQRKECEE